MRLSIACVLLLIAVAFPQVLNGQLLTNSVVGIVFALGAVIVASISFVRADAQSTKRFWCALTGSVAGVFILAMVVQLPKSFESQKSFNRTMDELKLRADRPAEDGVN